MGGENRVQITISVDSTAGKAEVTDFRRQLNELGDGATNAERSFASLGGTLGSVKGMLTGLGVAVVATELKDLGVAVFETGRQMETLDLSFKAIAGSSAGARAELSFIRQLARDYGQDFLSMAQSTKTFLAATKDTELAGSGAREVIKGVSAAVAALGLSSQDAQGVFLALGQMMSKGTVQAEELRGQLGERLPGAFGLAAKSMGVSTAELGKMLEQGQVLATDMVPKLAKALEQEYGQAAKEAGNTGTAAWNGMKTAVNDFYLALGDAGAFEFAKKMLRELASLANQTAHSIRAATGTLTGQAKLDWLNQRINQLESPEAMQTSPLTVDDSLTSSGAITAEIKRLKEERSLALSDSLDSQRTETARYDAASREKEQAKNDSLNKASQQATMEAWSKSKDPVVAAWAKFEVARSKSWKEVYSGKINQGAFEQEMEVHNEALTKAQQDAAKKGSAGANAAARGDIQGQQVLWGIQDQLAQVQAQFGGDNLGASLAKIERQYHQTLSTIQKDLVGAKGGVEAFKKAEALLNDVKMWQERLAVIADFIKQLDVAAKHEADLYKYTYGSQGSQLKADWLKGYGDYLKDLQQAGLGTDLADPEKIAQAEERWRAHQQFMLDEDVRRLGEGGKLSDEYWAAEARRLDGHLNQVKQHVTDENAFQVYAAQKRSELRRQELEAKLGYEDSFLGYAKDYLAIEFKLYQDQETRKRELWRDTMASAVGFLRQIGQELQTGLSDYMTALVTNDSAKREQAWRDMLQRMLNDAMRWIVDLGMMWAKQTLFVPVVASFVGVDSSGLEGLGMNISGSQNGSSGLSLSSIGKYGSYAKDAYGLTGGDGLFSGVTSSIDSWGASTLGWGSFSPVEQAGIDSAIAAGFTPAEAASNAVANGATVGTGTGLSSGLSAGTMGLGAGIMAGQMLAPKGNSTASSAVGGAAGLGTGMFASYMGAGSWAGPYGIAAAVIAAAITAALTPATKSYSWGVPQASQPAVWVVNGEDVAASYGVIKTTTSGFAGSESTNHTTIYDLANPTISAEVTAGMEAASASLKAFSKSLGQSDAEFKETMKGAQSLMIAIPEGYEEVVYHNLANLKAEHYLKQMGLIDQANGLLQTGESYIDMITRTETAANTAAAALGVVGLSLEQMSGSAERLVQGDWASQVITAMGGTDAFAGAMTRFNSFAYSSAEQAEHAMQYFGGKAIESMGAIQASGLNLQNFWDQYRTRMESGNMSPAEFKTWADAAVWVEQAYSAATTATEQQTQALQEQVSLWNQTRQILASTATQLTKTIASLRDFLHSLRTDEYTTLSPTANLAERQAKYIETRNKAMGGDTEAQDEFRQYAQDFREFAYDFYGANADYVAIDQMIQTDTASLISAADLQLQATNEEIARLDAQIAAAQLQISGTALVNDNLARVAGAVESSGASIVGAINSIGGSGSASTGQASAIQDANDAFLQLYNATVSAMLGSSAETPFDSAIGYADGGLVTGGIPGVDSVPAWLMPGERVFNVEHSRIIERLAANTPVTDTSMLERLIGQLLTAVSTGNAGLSKLLAKVENNTSTMASEAERR